MLRLWTLLAPLVAAAFAGAPLVVCDDVQAPLSLDPHRQFAEKNYTVVQQIYEGLVRFDRQGRVEPALAVSWERPDPLRMRLRLRPGVRFHNAEPFDAEAVRFSIERILDPRTGFPGLGFIASLDRAEVVDPLTVDLVTKFPDGLLLNRLAWIVLMVPPRYTRESGPGGLDARPVGTGPFRFEARGPGERLRLSANPDYWMPGRPRVGALEFRFLPWDRQVPELLAGNLDILTELPGTRTTEVVRSTGARVVKRETFYTMVGPFNLQSGPTRDRRVRLALNHALNRKDLIRYDLLGNGRVLATLTMPGEEGHDPGLRPYPYDPERARKLLREAGYPDGLELKVLAKEQGMRTVGILQRQLERVGVRLRITTTTDARIVADIASGSWDALFGGCPDPMVHAYFIQSIVFHSKSPYSIVRSDRFDRLLERMASTVDPAERAARARELDRFVYEEAMSLFTYQRVKTYGVSRKVRFAPPVTGMPYFREVEKDGSAFQLGQKP